MPMTEGEKLEVVRAGNYIHYACGCMYTYDLIGPRLGENLVTCFAHANNREYITQQTLKAWERITSEVRSRS